MSASSESKFLLSFFCCFTEVFFLRTLPRCGCVIGTPAAQAFRGVVLSVWDPRWPAFAPPNLVARFPRSPASRTNIWAGLHYVPVMSLGVIVHMT